MIATKRYIRNLRDTTFLNITPEMERKILEEYGKEPDPDDEGHRNIYTEEDLWHNIDKIIRHM